jgi:hypothetical protein
VRIKKAILYVKKILSEEDTAAALVPSRISEKEKETTDPRQPHRLLYCGGNGA